MSSFMKYRDEKEAHKFKGKHGFISKLYGCIALLFEDETGGNFFSTICF